MTLKKVEILLANALNSTGEDRAKSIKDVQELIWESENAEDESIDEILSALAYDLDFYEPDEEMRKEDPSFYGDDRVEEELKRGLKHIRDYKNED